MDPVDNSAELKQKIRSLQPKEKVKAVALTYYLELKKKADEDMEEEMKVLQKRYDQKSVPIFDEIQQLVAGLRVPKSEELVNASKYLTAEELASVATHTVAAATIPHYWLTVLKNGDLDELSITERDEDALQSLVSIECLHAENKQDYTLRFRFGENEHFANAYLDKTFVHGPKGEVQRAEGTKIEWREGKNLTKKVVKKKQKNKRSGAQRTISKEVDAESFFQFFRTLDVAEIEKQDDDTQVDQQEQLQVDEDLGSLLIDELIPYSVEYYLGIKQEQLGEEGETEGKEKLAVTKADDEDFSDEEEEKPKAKASKPTKKKK